MQQIRDLVCDDDNICLDVLSEVLVEEQFKVAAFPRATCHMTLQKEACCPMESPCYDILLTDNQMPDMTGLEFLELQQCNGCKIPAHRKAIISGNWTIENLDKAAKIGCQTFHKPYGFDKITTWIEVSQKKDQQLK